LSCFLFAWQRCRNLSECFYRARSNRSGRAGVFHNSDQRVRGHFRLDLTESEGSHRAHADVGVFLEEWSESADGIFVTDTTRSECRTYSN